MAVATATRPKKIELHARLDEDLHQALSDLVARDEGRRSLNTLLNQAVRRGLGEMTRRRRRDEPSAARVA